MLDYHHFIDLEKRALIPVKNFKALEDQRSIRTCHIRSGQVHLILSAFEPKNDTEIIKGYRLEICETETDPI